MSICKFLKLKLAIVFISSNVNVFAADNSGDLITDPVFNCSDISPNEDYVNFESGQVRPLALSSDNKYLYVANTPANCLEIFRVKGKKLKRVSAIQVGLEPVSLAVKNHREIWVVNHLSDSVSVVDIKGTPYVKRTIQVGDEPRDIVFAGTTKKRAFITTAHRGQNNPNFEFTDLTTPGIGRANVWVYDANKIGRGLSGEPVDILTLFTDAPRALAVSADEKTVYAAGFLTSNQTTAIDLRQVDNDQPIPNATTHGELAPRTPLIVKYNGSAWVDESGKDWSDKIMLSLPDKDIFAINADATPPVVTQEYHQVGTVLFNMAVNPTTNSLYVSNTEALNHIRFEGAGEGNTTVRGHTAENRITVIKGDDKHYVHLNPHVNFDLPMGEFIPLEEKAKSVAQPLEIKISSDGGTAYVAGFGSSKIIAIPTRQLENNNYTPKLKRQISVPGGPTGLALSSNDKFLYVYSRFDNVISVVNTKKNKVINQVSLYNPEPEHVTAGRPFLYDANLTSSNGTGACASCHIFADLDALAWDLGDPDGEIVDHPLEEVDGNPIPMLGYFQPMKGPMLTQTFRGMAHGGPMHWRGDKTGTNPVIVDGELESQEAAAFKEFNGAFVSLIGREEVLTEAEMQAFTNFALSVNMPPNPIRNLDNSLTPSQQAGKEVYFNFPADFGVNTCNDCHTLDPENNKFGAGKMFGGGIQDFAQDTKIPHFSNVYQRVGMFGGTNNGVFFGDQVRGFGYRRDGTLATALDFIFNGAFLFDDIQQGFDVGDFLMVYPTEHMPVVGQQVTLSRKSGVESVKRFRLLLQQAKKGDCALEASGLLKGSNYHGVFDDGMFVSLGHHGKLKPKQLKQKAIKRGSSLTVTCKPI